MDDLISRQAAIDAIGKTSDELYKNIKKGATFPQRQWFDGMAQAQSILENQPSAQPEIIRCKDCKWWSNDDYRECSNPNYDDGYVTPAGFYCGYAERKDDE